MQIRTFVASSLRPQLPHVRQYKTNLSISTATSMWHYSLAQALNQYWRSGSIAYHKFVEISSIRQHHALTDCEKGNASIAFQAAQLKHDAI